MEIQLAQRLAEGDDDDYRPEFDSEEFFLRFDEENYPIDIPDEIIDDLDNDFNVEIPTDPNDEDWVYYYLIIILNIIKLYLYKS